MAFARDGRGTRRPLGDPDRPIQRDWLNAGQRRAVKHILSSRDRVILVRGAAGTGKTTLMQEAVEGDRAGRASGGGAGTFGRRPAGTCCGERVSADADTVAHVPGGREDAGSRRPGR